MGHTFLNGYIRINNPRVPLSIAMLRGLSVLQWKRKHVDLCVGMRGKLLQNVPVVGMKVSVPC